MADIDKVKRNIQRMIDQNAPESDIDAYVASEGVTVEELRASKPVSMAGDIAKSAGIGAVEGGIDILGGFGDSRKVGADFLKWGADKVGFGGHDKAIDFATKALMGPLGVLPTSGDIKSSIEANTGEFYQPQTTAGKYANTATRFAVNSAIGPGGTVKATAANMGRGAIAGLTSEAAGQATEGSVFEPAARVAGGIIGGISPDLMRAGWNKVRMSMRGADEKAAAKVIEQLAASGMTPDEAMAKVRELGPEAMLADTSPGMQTFTGGTAIADSGAGNTIGTRLAARREAAPGRIATALDNSLGPYADPQNIADSIKAERATASPAYKALQGQVVDIEPAIDLAMQEGNRFGFNSPIGKDVKTILDMLVDETGKPIANGERVHAARIQIDSMIKEAKRSGRDYGVLNGIRKQIDQAVKQVPGMAEADKLWSDTAKIQEAYDFGQKELLGKSVFPGQLQNQLKNTPLPEQQAMTQGARAKLAMDFSGAAKNPTVGLERTLQGSMNDQKLPQLIGQDKFNNLSKALDAETTFIETSAMGEATRGSRTGNIMDSAKEVWGAKGGTPSAVGDVMAAGTAGTVMGGPAAGTAAAAAVGMGKLTKTLSQALRRKSQPEIIQAAADILTQTGGDIPKAVALMNKVATQINASPMDRRVLVNAVLTVRPAIAQGNQSPQPVGQ